MANGSWVRVSVSSPCPVCKSPDWCSVSGDGALCKCMRVEDGSFRAKEDRNGARYYLHRLAEGSGPSPPPPRPGPEAKRAPAEALHDAYTGLLKRLSLSAAHRQALRERGLSDEAIDRAGYKSLPPQGRARHARALHGRLGDALLRVPGFVVAKGKHGDYLTVGGAAGTLVPCRDLQGRVTALKVRRDDAGRGGPRYLYLSSAGHGGPGPGSPAHVPLGAPAAADLVRVVEGELKADVAQALTGVPTVSAPGATNWRPALGVLKAMGCKTARLAFDADAADNPHVARALSGCAAALRGAGLAVQLERWGGEDGKGLDDLLAAGKVPQLLTGQAAAEAIEEAIACATADEPAEPDDLGRLQDVLSSGGAEALFRDDALMEALARQAQDDPAGFAATRASLRERVSVRDLDKALRPFKPRPSPDDGAAPPPYFVEGGRICRSVPTKEGPVTVPLCNFTARVAEDVVHDDGAEQSRSLALEGALDSGQALPRAEVPAADFARMDWVVPAWGTGAVVFAGRGTKDHLRAAVQVLSGEVRRRTVFGHLGWRKLDDGWAFLHASGAVGAAGHLDVPVVLPPALSGYALPEPLAPLAPDVALACGPLGRAARAEAACLTAAVRASLGLLRLGPDRLTFPLLAAVYRAPLGGSDFALHLAGPTGTFKSEAAALCQQHYGAGLDARHLPANWASTGNALEGLAFAAKDALFCVDDFCPAGSAADVQRAHKDADRLFRGQGNHAGRLRMRADGGLRPARPPRALTLSTGEDVPRGQSLRARLLVLEVSPGDLSQEVLGPCQEDARQGRYALALAGYLRWLAPQYEVVAGGLRAEAAELRDRAGGAGQHARTPGIVADLALGLRYFLRFALDVGAVTEEERGALWERGWRALTEAGAAQASQVATAEPAGLFVRLLSAAIAGGQAHVASPEGGEPKEPQRWGWRPEEFYAGDGTDTRLKPQGARVGWLADGELYLEPDTSFAAVQRFARDQSDGFPITPMTLRRRLNEQGLLASTDKGRGKLTVRKVLQGERREVLHLRLPGDFCPDETGPTAESGADDNGRHERSASTVNLFVGKARGPVGRKGRSCPGREANRAENVPDHETNGWGEWQ